MHCKNIFNYLSFFFIIHCAPKIKLLSIIIFLGENSRTNLDCSTQNSVGSPQKVFQHLVAADIWQEQTWGCRHLTAPTFIFYSKGLSTRQNSYIVQTLKDFIVQEKTLFMFTHLSIEAKHTQIVGGVAFRQEHKAREKFLSSLPPATRPKGLTN